jgi:N-acetylglutamate synthase-like GNAT family acetyltransferase
MIQIREFENRDLDGCVRLLQSGHDPDFTVERFRWLHLVNTLAPSRMAVAEDAGQIVGFYGVIKKKILCGGVEYCGGRDVDPVVHPGYRGQGIFSRLLEYGIANFSEVDIFFNFANAASAPGFLRKGWQVAGNLDDRVFQVAPDWSPKQILLYCLCWGKLALQPRFRAGETRIEEVQPERVARLLTELKTAPGNGLEVIRDGDYLRWRYLDKPGPGYRFLLESRAGRPEKLYILNAPGGGEVALCDVVAADGAQPSLQALFAHLRREGGPCKVKVWDRFPEALGRELVRKPFGGGRGCNFLVRRTPGSSLPESACRFDNWTITHGDLEVM